jgi:hypothetical protein
MDTSFSKISSTDAEAKVSIEEVEVLITLPG